MVARGNQPTTPVGNYEPNGYGLFDMAGNIGEEFGILLLSQMHRSLMLAETCNQGMPEFWMATKGDPRMGGESRASWRK